MRSGALRSVNRGVRLPMAEDVEHAFARPCARDLLSVCFLVRLRTRLRAMSAHGPQADSATTRVERLERSSHCHLGNDFRRSSDGREEVRAKRVNSSRAPDEGTRPGALVATSVRDRRRDRRRRDRADDVRQGRAPRLGLSATACKRALHPTPRTSGHACGLGVWSFWPRKHH
jgi:hypothetical protein